jgi:nitrate reductase gamma subunit
MRLLIIEIGAFGLGLATLFSVIIFIIRQIKQTLDIRHVTSDKSHISNLISHISFAILLLLIISGLWVADFYRWGSSWYAGVLTPYLRSLIKFYPDISAVQLMPFTVKVHIVSAFLIIGIFPFTGLFSFLVYTISYLSVKKQTNYLYIYGLIGAGAIATSLALYFGNSFEAKKSVNKLNLTTTDNKVIKFENKESKEIVNYPDTTSKQSNITDTITNKTN